MKKTILYRLFGLGKVPKKLRAALEAEEIVVQDEGFGGWFVSKRLNAPGKRFRHRREGFSGCLVITKKRVIAYTYAKRQINVGVEDSKISELYAKLIGTQKLVLSFESSSFRPDWQGVIELHMNTSKALDFYHALISVGVQEGMPV